MQLREVKRGDIDFVHLAVVEGVLALGDGLLLTFNQFTFKWRGHQVVAQGRVALCWHVLVAADLKLILDRAVDVGKGVARRAGQLGDTVLNVALLGRGEGGRLR